MLVLSWNKFFIHAGLLFLPGYLNSQEQQQLIAAALNETTGPASRTNLDSHYQPPLEGWWSQYVSDSDTVISPKYTGTSTPEFSERKVERRVAIDLEPMNEQAFHNDLKTLKTDPAPSETVQPTALTSLIRKLRWSIIGLEYHVSDTSMLLPCDIQSQGLQAECLTRV